MWRWCSLHGLDQEFSPEMEQIFVFGFRWQKHISQQDILKSMKISSIFFLLSECCLWWLVYYRSHMLYGKQGTLVIPISDLWIATKGAYKTAPSPLTPGKLRPWIMLCSITLSTKADTLNGQLAVVKQDRRKEALTTPLVQALQYICNNCNRDEHSQSNSGWCQNWAN